jgi:hypothetical protein
MDEKSYSDCELRYIREEGYEPSRAAEICAKEEGARSAEETGPITERGQAASHVACRRKAAGKPKIPRQNANWPSPLLSVVNGTLNQPLCADFKCKASTLVGR